MLKISIIVPVYQAERSIARCLDSLLAQNIVEYEILCINDGSTDKSGEIILKYANQYPQIKYFFQTNQGVSAARNRGLQEAKGQYIMFVDADDRIKKNKLKFLYEKVCEQHTDILVFGGRAERWLETPEWVKNAFYTRKKNYNDKSVSALLNEVGAKPSVCNKVFSTRLLEEKKFLEGIHVAEDLAFLFTVFPDARNICFIPQTIYIYDTSNLNSAMHKVENSKDDFFEYHLSVVEYILEEWEQHNLLFNNKEEILNWMIHFLDYLYIKLDEEKRKQYDTRLRNIESILSVSSQTIIRELDKIRVTYNENFICKYFKSCIREIKCYGIWKGFISIIGKVYLKIKN